MFPWEENAGLNVAAGGVEESSNVYPVKNVPVFLHIIGAMLAGSLLYDYVHDGEGR